MSAAMARASPCQDAPKTNGHAPTPGPKKREPLERNVNEAILGNGWIKPWYPSFYPEELVGRTLDTLYVCQWCFKYTKDLVPYMGHQKLCVRNDMSEILGEPIYSKDSFSIHEVDGEEHKLYTQNLSLFAKLFLDTKSVFYDVTTFLYYLLVYRDPAFPNARAQVVGFFSKEKLSWDNNNLACILVFPPWQKRGFGQVLMGVSYELGRREGRLGGPEKPLSELGKRGYIHYWSGVIARYIIALPSKKSITVQTICDDTYIIPEDIITTLQDMGVLEHRKKGNANAVVNKAKVREWAAAHRISMESPIDIEAFNWIEDEAEYEEKEEE